MNCKGQREFRGASGGKAGRRLQGVTNCRRPEKTWRVVMGIVSSIDAVHTQRTFDQ